MNFEKYYFFRKILLNNKPLNLIDDKLPDLNPDVMIDSDDLKLELSSGEIGFWVIPDAKVNENRVFCLSNFAIC